MRPIEEIEAELDEATEESEQCYHTLGQARDSYDDAKCRVEMLEEELAQAKKEAEHG